LRTSCAFSILV